MRKLRNGTAFASGTLDCSIDWSSIQLNEQPPEQVAGSCEAVVEGVRHVGVVLMTSLENLYLLQSQAQKP